MKIPYKMRFTPIIIIIIFLFSFCQKQQSKLILEKIYGDMCDESSFLSFQKDSLIIIENSGYDEEFNANYFYRAAVKSSDTLLPKKIFVKNQKSIEQIKNQLKTSPILIHNIGKFKFDYNNVPDSLLKVFNKEEEVLYFKEQAGLWVYHTRNNKNGIYRIYASQKGKQNSAFVNLGNSPEKSDIMLFDIIGNETPEIFVIRKAHLMNHDLREIEIYQISNTITNRGFF